MDIVRPQTVSKKAQRGKKKDENSLKVVYISSPMKVRTSASKFRSLVQELTGKNSDIAQYMDADGAAACEFHDDGDVLAKNTSGHQMLSSVSSDDTNTTTTTTTTTTSESFLGTMDNVFTSQMVDQFGGVF